MREMQTNSFDCVDNTHTCQLVVPDFLDDLSLLDFGDSGWSVRRADETQAHVETLDMLDFTKVFYSLLSE